MSQYRISLFFNSCSSLFLHVSHHIMGLYLNNHCSVWIGGSILASLGSFQQMWFSKAEWVFIYLFLIRNITLHSVVTCKHKMVWWTNIFLEWPIYLYICGVAGMKSMEFHIFRENAHEGYDYRQAWWYIDMKNVLVQFPQAGVVFVANWWRFSCDDWRILYCYYQYFLINRSLFNMAKFSRI